jgi:DNA-binding HxlR family transcriptional regulator
MPLRAYGQFCGFARALEVVGERWALLIVRNLLVSPRRFTDLHRGLPGIPTNVLTARLKELEDDGVVRRAVLPRPSGAVVYELTAYGRELESVVVGLGRWGAKTLGDVREGEVLTSDSVRIAMMSTLVPQAAKGSPISFELRMGPVVVWAKLAGGKLVTGEGPLPEADVIFETGPVVRALMARELTVAAAIATGRVKLVRGRRAGLERFVELFKIAPLPKSG